MSTHDPSDFEIAFGAVIDDVIELLATLKLPHMLIGGLAIAVRGEPRATKDIDLAVKANAVEAGRLAAEMADLGFRAIAHGAIGPGAVIRFVRADSDGVERWVDVLCAGTPFEETAIARARDEALLGRTLPVATAEDLVIFKLLAARPQDLADVDVLLRAHPETLDNRYIDARASEWGIEDLLSKARQTAEDG